MRHPAASFVRVAGVDSGVVGWSVARAAPCSDFDKARVALGPLCELKAGLILFLNININLNRLLINGKGN